MTATPCLIGRSSSHFTRVPRMLALELGVDLAFQPVYDLGSRQTADYGGNPAMKLPVLPLDAYPMLARFTDSFGQRASAQQTAYRFDTPPAA